MYIYIYIYIYACDCRCSFDILINPSNINVCFELDRLGLHFGRVHTIHSPTDDFY